MTTNELSVFRKNEFNTQHMNNRRSHGRAVFGCSIVVTGVWNVAEGMDVGFLVFCVVIGL